MKSTAKLLQHNVKSRYYLKKSVLFFKKTSLLFLPSKDTTFFAIVQIKWTDWPKLQCLKQFRLTPHKQCNEHTQQYKIPLIDNFQKFTIFNIENEGSTHKKQSYSKEISFSIHKIHCHYRFVTETLSRDSRRSADGQPTVNYTNVVGLLYHFT